MVVMDSQKQKDLKLNRYATVCEHNQRFRLLQTMLCTMQFTYALRQLQVGSHTIITHTPIPYTFTT